MFPIFDTPAVHHAVREAAEAGIEQVVFVLSPGQDAITDYFQRLPELEAALERRGESEMLVEMRAIHEMVEVSYVHQHEALGLGHAILLTRTIIGDEPFAVFLPDDVIWSEAPAIGLMMGVFEERGGCVIAVEEVPDEMVPNLGIVKAAPIADRTYRIEGMVEKPSLAEAPSNLAIIGRYVLTPEVFDTLSHTKAGAGGEIQLTDALALLLKEQPEFAYRFPGAHFDVGTPLGLLKASIHAALGRDDVAAEFRGWLSEAL
jgi:UTP--glucose-1-phosphate uridylyltransferase